MKQVLPTAVLALLLTGCGGGEPAAEPQPAGPTSAAPASEAPTSKVPETTESPEPEVLSPGTYTFDTFFGTTGTMEVPGEPVPAIEELREQAGADPVTYITATIDNRQGDEAFDFYQVSIYDPAGKEYIYTPAGEWLMGIIPPDMASEQYNDYVDLSNSLVEIVDPRQRVDSVLVGPPVPEEIAGVTVSDGFETYDAMPAE